MNKRPKVSICTPIHNMDNAAFFLRRLMQSLETQTFKDFEIVITKEGKMAENTNAAIKKCKGEIIKILYMDDALFEETALQDLVDNFNGGWAATGCMHDFGELVGDYHTPSFDGIVESRNTIGSPSVVAFENKSPLLFDENMSWLLDVDYYQRLFDRYGPPTLIDKASVLIGVHKGQMTNILTSNEKLNEDIYLREKRGKRL